MIIGLFLVAVILQLCFHFWRRQKLRLKKLPPIPAGSMPLLGHLPWLTEDPHKVIMKWGHELGPVVMLNFGSLPVVVINDAESIKKAFKSPKLSGRPHLKLFDDLSLNRQGMVLTDGPAANELRNFYLKQLNSFTKDGSMLNWRISQEVSCFLQRVERLQGSPCQVKGIFQRNIVNTLLNVLAGRRFGEADDTEATKFADMITELTRIPDIVELLGIYLPTLSALLPRLVGHQKRCNTRDHVINFFDAIAEEHRSSRVKGQPRDILDSYLDKMEDTTDDSSCFHASTDNLSLSFAEIFAAAMETTSTHLEWIVYYMAKHPEIQLKVQAEIDLVIGHREPCLSDRTDLPYAEAVILETMRTPTAGPFGVQHSTLWDYELNGYLIPKGTMVLANLYAVHHDPMIWGRDAHVFRPERFIDTQTGKIGCKKDNLMPFSHGRRSCIGETLARNQLFLFTVSIFQRFRVRFFGDGTDLADKPTFGMSIAPAPFRVEFIPRFTNSGFAKM